MKKRNHCLITAGILLALTSILLCACQGRSTSAYGDYVFSSEGMADNSQVKVFVACPYPSVPSLANVYQQESLTSKTDDEYAYPILSALGEEPEQMQIERNEMRTDYVNSKTHANLQLMHNGPKFLYQRRNGPAGPAAAPKNQEELVSALTSLGLHLPRSAEISISEDGHCTLVADSVENSALYKGEISCTYSQDGKFLTLCNDMIYAPFFSQEFIITPEEAVNQVIAGKVSDPALDLALRDGVSSLTIQDIKLVHFPDSKGYWQPIYAMSTDLQDMILYIPAIENLP